MNLLFSAKAWNQYLYWQAEDAHVLRRINALLKDAERDAFRGLGKPEPLKAEFAGYWSRRITAEHRLVYKAAGSGEDQRLIIVQCRFHYESR